ncbi:helix-turn-helix domain-containing protein [Paenibacillus ginsengarvi]|uniref:Helix-turn-helix domain-containing protein n=1 Tax=Paenibacillus ginsengarvi TaxID=400777 RepID=A0A3B0CCL5_9BACL|nr:helix-turn-helix domain-containing protein [Paenibacillus ginsengarvi]RKN82258.1 helix-turn-helix domain-containing protein [Paenibacillus ginsengarvi]
MNTNAPIQSAIDYIEMHLSEPLELAQIADKAYMSVPNLYRAFYALTGHPIKEYIRKRRLSQSAWLLRHSDKAVVDIAFECGFDSYQTFAKMFKKVVGMTPGAYRKSVVHYSFEAMSLPERVCYLEEGELSARYPDVKVIRLLPMQVAVYRHRSGEREGLEEEAVRTVFELLDRLGAAAERLRFYGTNTQLPSADRPYGYDILIPLAGPESDSAFQSEAFRITTFPGGLYAVGKCPETTGADIVAAWDRLLCQWLPRSAFELGAHPYIEQYFTYRGAVTRMNLHLPVQRQMEPETLDTIFVKPVTVVVCRAYGPSAQNDADDRLTTWLIQEGLTGNPELKLFMSYSYSVKPGDEFWYELSVSLPDNRAAACSTTDSGTSLGEWGGGLYACATSGAYGLMTGVLDKIHRWLYENEIYAADASRQWFAEYVPGEGTDLERSTSVKCYVPVIQTACRNKGGM